MSDFKYIELSGDDILTTICILDWYIFDMDMKKPSAPELKLTVEKAKALRAKLQDK